MRLHAQGKVVLTLRQGFRPGWVHIHTTSKSLFDFGSRLRSTRRRYYPLNAKEVPERFLDRNCWLSVLLGGSKRYSWDGCVAIWYVIQVIGDQVVGLLSVSIWSTRVLVCVIQKNVKKAIQRKEGKFWGNYAQCTRSGNQEGNPSFCIMLGQWANKNT